MIDRLFNPNDSRPLIEPPFVVQEYTDTLEDSAGISYEPTIHYEGFDVGNELHITKCSCTLQEVMRTDLEESVMESIRLRERQRVRFETVISFEI